MILDLKLQLASLYEPLNNAFNYGFKFGVFNTLLNAEMCNRRQFVIDYVIDYHFFLLIRNRIRHFLSKSNRIRIFQKNTCMDLKKLIVQVKN